MKVMTYNIKDGGEDFLAELGEILVQAGPDIIAIEEANDEFVFESLAALLGFEHVLGEGNRGYHVGIISRYPILKSQNHGGTNEFFHTMLEAQIAAPGYLLSIFAAHLYPGYGVALEQHRIEEVRAILGYMAPQLENPCLLMGDFNTISPQDNPTWEGWPWPWRQQMRAQEEGIGREAIQAILDSDLTDCFRAMFPDSGEYPGFTLPAPRPDVRLDYIFANNLMLEKLESCQVWQADPAPKTSDHLPLLAEFAG
jgi:endonuclease/exonuclease/phosphatase family metal-dependent hydrolase